MPKKIAILSSNGFEVTELTGPKKAFEDAGHQVDVVSPSSGTIRAYNDDSDKGKVEVDRKLSDANVADYAALVIPGGTENSDALRNDSKAVQFTKDFAAAGKPVAAICHAPWVLAEAGLASGRDMTSYPGICDDMKAAGANWSDVEVARDGNFITSRKPEDVPAFSKAVLNAL
ncbi:MAG: type 1 glutamine amidotransferase domain-containing protein [Pseudoxanthomonas suwonensis]|nr:type 1 glutamine amidotransferase domain-containing protein [Pseudoxanthomonas suwonensis]